MSGSNSNLVVAQPLPSSPIVDLKTGNLTSPWLNFLSSLYARTGSGPGPGEPAQDVTQTAIMGVLGEGTDSDGIDAQKAESAARLAALGDVQDAPADPLQAFALDDTQDVGPDPLLAALVDDVSDSLAPYAPIAGGVTFTGPHTINTGTADLFAINGTNNGRGAELEFNGSGGTTPNKSIRVLGGVLGVVNSAYSVVIMSMDDSGNVTFQGAVTGPSVALAGGPTWTTGTLAPSATAPVGSLYSRVGGAISSTLYVSRGAGTWLAVSGV